MQYTAEQKQNLCTRLTALPPSRTKEIYSLIVEYSKSSTLTFPKRLGSKVTTAFGGRLVGDDYEFDMDHFPEPLLKTIEQLLNAE
jgi:hypothetical protein